MSFQNFKIQIQDFQVQMSKLNLFIVNITVRSGAKIRSGPSKTFITYKQSIKPFSWISKKYIKYLQGQVNVLAPIIMVFQDW